MQSDTRGERQWVMAVEPFDGSALHVWVGSVGVGCSSSNCRHVAHRLRELSSCRNMAEKVRLRLNGTKD
jgi:hypothetical protein